MEFSYRIFLLFLLIIPIDPQLTSVLDLDELKSAAMSILDSPQNSHPDTTLPSVPSGNTDRISPKSFLESLTIAPEDTEPRGITVPSNIIEPGPDTPIRNLCPAEHDAEINAMILEKMMPLYNKQILPNSTGAVETRVEIHINAIPHISELNSFFELDLFFSELWHEPRLAFLHLPQAECVKNITLGLEYLQKVWTPNVCIVNSKAAVIHSSPSENVFLILYQDGTLWKNCRMLVRGPCTIDLRLFPFDVQTCSLIFESYSYNSQKVTLHWVEGAAVRLAKSIELPDFVLSQYLVNRTYITYPNGYWDQLKVTFVFERRYGFFIMQAYLPTYMTVFVAWINFWMDPKELATRATLAISAFLAMCLQLGTVQQNQPRVSYAKAMDVWMLGSISFLFFALIELAIISYMLRTDKRRRGNKKKPAKSIRSSQDYEESTVSLARNVFNQSGCPYKCTCLNSIAGEDSTIGQSQSVRPSKMIRVTSGQSYLNLQLLMNSQRWNVYGVDKFFLIIYPPAYLLFNVFYWTYYLR